MSDAEKIAPQYDKGQRAFEAYVLWRHNAAHSIPVIRRMWEHLSGEERSAWLVVPLTTEALETLRAIPVHLHCQWVFHHGGEPYRNVASRFRQLVLSAQKTAQEAGRQFRPFRFHDLRHLFAVEYLKGGGSLYALQKIMGHSSVKVTEMYLDYLTPQEADKARMTG